jgi:hypothetical protein
MNSICASLCRSKYALHEHLVIVVDGVPLDVLVASAFSPEQNIEGLVPTLLDWLDNSNERAIVWKRAIPTSGTRAYFPVLMCPDDCDFSCTIVIAEVETLDSQVHWHRLGIDDSDARCVDPASVGSEVKWATGLGPFVFDRDDYANCLARFQELLKI